MIRQIAPQFFTTNIGATRAWYRDEPGFDCQGIWRDPPSCAIAPRDHHAIHFRRADPPARNPYKYMNELLDVYPFVEDSDALCADYAAKSVEFTRGLANVPWGGREFVVRDCQGRLLAFGSR
jgi:hypothetical protein